MVSKAVGVWIFLKVRLTHFYGKESACNVGRLGLILNQEDPLEKGMAIYSSILAWRIPWTEEPDRLLSMGWQRVRHDWATSTLLCEWLDYFVLKMKMLQWTSLLHRSLRQWCSCLWQPKSQHFNRGELRGTGKMKSKINNCNCHWYRQLLLVANRSLVWCVFLFPHISLTPYQMVTIFLK